MRAKTWKDFLLISSLLINCYFFIENKTTRPISSDSNIYWTKNVLNCARNHVKWDRVEELGEHFGCYLYELMEWVISLNESEKKIYSQHGEDGITKSIFDKIGHGNKTFVEIGVENGQKCNSRILRESLGWTGIMFDKGHENLEIGLHKASIWVDNVVEILKSFHVPWNLDFLSIHTDFQDFWLFKKLLDADYRPRLIVAEINGNFDSFSSVSIPYEGAVDHNRWSGNRGASLLAFVKLFHKYDYQLIYVEKESVSAFFIHKSEINDVDLSMAYWTAGVSDHTKIGVNRHQPQSSEQYYVHICDEKQCNNSDYW